MGGYQQESCARPKTGWPSLPSRMSCSAAWCWAWKRIMNAVPSCTPACAAGGDHRLGLGDGQAERFLAEDVLAGARRRPASARGARSAGVAM